MRVNRSLPGVALVVLLVLPPVSRAALTPPQSDEAARSNEAKIALVQNALTHLDRDLNEMLRSRDELLNAMPSTQPQYAANEIDKVLADARKTLEIEGKLVRLWLDYAAKRKSHLPDLPELAAHVRRLAATDEALNRAAQLILSNEQEQFGMLTQLQQAYRAQDVARWNSLNQQYEALRQQGAPVALQAKQTLAEQEAIRAEVVTTLQNLLMSLRSRASKCAPFEQQLERDKEALRRQMKSNELGLKELEEWTKANKEAETAALKVAVKAIFGRVVENMEKRVNSARSFQGWLTRYEKAIKQRGVPFEALQDKIETAMRGYTNASIIAKSGEALKAGLLGEELWNLFRNESGAIAEQQAQSDAAVREILNNPTVKRLIQTDRAGAETAKSLLVLMSQSKELGKIIGPQVEFGVFIVDYGYEAAKWTASWRRIRQQINLTEEELKAVDALKKQIESTVQKLKDCRAPAVAVLSPVTCRS